MEIIGLRCLFKEDRNGCGKTSATTYMYIAFVFWGLGIAYMIWMGMIFNKVNLCIGIFRSALTITKRLDQLKFLPIYSVVIMMILVMVFILNIMFSFSVVEKTFIDAQRNRFFVKFLPSRN